MPNFHFLSGPGAIPGGRGFKNKTEKAIERAGKKSFTSPAASSRERVAMAVIVQGVKDIVDNNTRYIDFYNENWGTTRAVDHALWWFQDEAVDVGSYSWYCEVVGIDPDHIRKAINTGDWESLTAFAKVSLH